MTAAEKVLTFFCYILVTTTILVGIAPIVAKYAIKKRDSLRLLQMESPESFKFWLVMSFSLLMATTLLVTVEILVLNGFAFDFGVSIFFFVFMNGGNLMYELWRINEGKKSAESGLDLVALLLFDGLKYIFCKFPISLYVLYIGVLRAENIVAQTLVPYVE